MTTIDIVFGLFLLFFAYKGFTNGLIVSIATFLGLIIGFYAASYFSEYTADWLINHAGMQSKNIKFIAYILTFVITIVLIFFLGRFLTKIIKTVGLGLVNRLAGALLGIAKGALILSFLILFLNKIDPASKLISQDKKRESVFYKPVAATAPAIIPLLKKYTEKVQNIVTDSKENLKNKIPSENEKKY